MRILISHNNYPAQFRRIAPALQAAGHEVIFLFKNTEWHAQQPENGLRLHKYELHRQGGSEALHPYLRRFENCVLEGQAAARAAYQIAEEGWIPDCIINHVGFGNGFYLSDVFPSAKRIGLFEWFYNSRGADVDFLRRGLVEPDRAMRIRTWNAQVLIELAHCDCGVVPTQWQLDQFPGHLSSKLQVIHEGIDVNKLGLLKEAPKPKFDFLPDDPEIEILTYVSRGFEEYRGFPQAMETISQLQKRRPGLHALIVGSDVIAYGASRSDGRTWREWALQELKLDTKRTHWMGALQEDEYQKVLLISDVHLYLTVPFVLSWSLLEAMAAGCSIVGSNTPPVQEVLQSGCNGLLVDFFNPHDQVNACETLLDDQAMSERFSKAARISSQAFSHDKGLAGWRAIIESCG